MEWPLSASFMNCDPLLTAAPLAGAVVNNSRRMADGRRRTRTGAKRVALYWQKHNRTLQCGLQLEGPMRHRIVQFEGRRYSVKLEPIWWERLSELWPRSSLRLDSL